MASIDSTIIAPTSGSCTGSLSSVWGGSILFTCLWEYKYNLSNKIKEMKSSHTRVQVNKHTKYIHIITTGTYFTHKIRFERSLQH